MMSTINVRDYGAVGDGRNDDTKAIRKATAALPEKGGVLFFPPGHYLSDTIKARDFTTYRGDSAWGYRPSERGGTVLSPVRPDQPCLFDARKKCGTRFAGLTLYGSWDRGSNDLELENAKSNTREEMHGILSSHPGYEQNIAIDDCRIEHFTGSGVKLDKCWVWAIRHSIIMYNRLDGIDAYNSYDAWVIDSLITANGRAGLRVLASTTITGNRIEWNDVAGIILPGRYAAGIQITGNLLCCNRGPAIEHDGDRAEGITITGNTIRHLAPGLLKVNSDSNRACHVRLIGMQGLCFTGNSFYCEKAPTVPCAMILGRLKDSVVSNNTLFNAATKELIRDEGGHENTIIANNPGTLLCDGASPL